MISRKELYEQMSRQFLLRGLDEFKVVYGTDWYDMGDEEFYSTIEQVARKPFEYYSGHLLYEIIDAAVSGMIRVLNEKGIEVKDMTDKPTAQDDTNFMTKLDRAKWEYRNTESYPEFPLVCVDYIKLLEQQCACLTAENEQQAARIEELETDNGTLRERVDNLQQDDDLNEHNKRSYWKLRAALDAMTRSNHSCGKAEPAGNCAGCYAEQLLSRGEDNDYD